MTSIFIGIDLGTSGCRAYAIDENTNIVATSDKPFPPSTLESTSENEHIVQKPSDWWQICQDVLSDLLNKLDRESVKAIAIDGTSGTVLLCDKKGKPLTNGYMYNDNSCRIEAEQIRTLAPDESGAHGASSGLSKCLYLLKGLSKNEPNQTGETCLSQADWIAGNFLNRYDTSDDNNALKLGYDPIRQKWPLWLKNIEPKQIERQNLDLLTFLPKRVLQPGEISGCIDKAIADYFQLPLTTKIIAGTTDSIAAFIATGSDKVGEAVTSLGSTLAIKLISDKPVFAPNYGVYSHRLGNKWLVGGASNAGGAVLKSFFTTEELAHLSAQIDTTTSSKLNYYPLITAGERFPINDPLKQPALSPRPENDAQFLHGLLEGIAKIEKIT